MSSYKVIKTNWIAGHGNGTESYYRSIAFTSLQFTSIIIVTGIRIIRTQKLTTSSS